MPQWWWPLEMARDLAGCLTSSVHRAEAGPTEHCIDELRSPHPDSHPGSLLRVFPVTAWIKLQAPLLGFLWNSRSYCNQILPSRKNLMQRGRMLHSQAAEKSFFVLRLNTWNTLSAVATVERGLWRLDHTPIFRGHAAQCSVQLCVEHFH